MAEDSAVEEDPAEGVARWCNEHLKCVSKRVGKPAGRLGDGLLIIALLEGQRQEDEGILSLLISSEVREHPWGIAEKRRAFRSLKGLQLKEQDQATCDLGKPGSVLDHPSDPGRRLTGDLVAPTCTERDPAASQSRPVLAVESRVRFSVMCVVHGMEHSLP
uniref:Uncharacterized protein n=1 Tax=Sphaerodactylus townsendi TaxID=933632 RepID=A0ACB8ENM2_9SAUR